MVDGISGQICVLLVLSVACTLRALQRMAYLVSVFALLFNVLIFHYCGFALPPPPEFLVVHSRGWCPTQIPIRTAGGVKSLGDEYPINSKDVSSFDSAYQLL